MTPSDRASILVLTCRGAPHYALINALAQSHDIRGIVFEKHVGLKFRLLRRRLRTLGIATVVNQLLFKVIDVLLHRKREASETTRLFGPDLAFDSTRIPNATVLETASVNADEVVELVRQLAPDVVVVSGTSLLEQRLLSVLDSTPVINMHCGITPRYRGNHGAYWAVVNGDWENAGTTVHLIDAGVDTGGIISQAVIDVEPEDNPRTLALKQYRAGILLMVDVVPRTRSGNLTTIQRPDLNSRFHSSPTLTSYMRYRKHMRERFSKPTQEPDSTPDLNG